MLRIEKKLRRSGSALALIVGLGMSGAAYAQNAGAQEDTLAPDIIVTGSSIRGVAPVGSNLVTAGQADIKATASTNITEITNTIPAITSAGSAPQGENAYSGFAPSIHGIGGSSSNSTLVLIDGLRMVGGGTQYAQPDPNTIPTTALERVEVITDGASSIYGSDAVSGVINYITRRTYDGVEVNGRVGFGDEYRSYDTSMIVGRKWDGGGVYLAAQYTNQSAMPNTARPFTVMGDYRAQGGSNTNSFNCSPATIRTPDSGSGIYPSPSAMTTIPNNVTENGFCNNSIYGNGIPGTERINLLASSVFEFGSGVRLRTMVNFDNNVGKADAVPGQLGGISVFGPGSPASRTDQINPFYLAPAGDPGATSETINAVILRPDGKYGQNRQENTTFYGTSVLDADLFGDWTGTLSLAAGRANSTREGRDIFCNVCALLSLNGTTQVNGSTTASSIPNQSAIVTNLPLTTSNALDVWRPIGANQTPQSVLDYIYSNDDVLRHQNSFEQVKASTQGSLFELPAGDLRVSVGTEYMWLRQHITDQGPGLTGNTAVSSNVVDFTLRRNVYSVFGEAYVPVISSDMEIPLVEQFDLSLSLRYDHYNDFGGTTNPKIAATWELIRGLKIRGNWGKSFVAPAMLQVGDPSRGFARGANGAGNSGALNVPVDLYPEVLQVPGCAGSTTVCRIGTGINPGLTRSLGAGLAGTKPQLGESWSIGLDLTPELLPNFRAAVTYWNTKFTGATSVPAVELILGSGALHDRLQICPTGCTAAQIDTFTQVSNGAPFNTVLPPTTYFLMDRNLENLLNFDVSGIDAQADYRLITDSVGTFTLGGSITYFTKYNQWFFDAPKFSILNTSGFNSQFPSIQTRGRARLSWELGGFSASYFLNFTGSYRNWLSTTVEPRTQDENGNPNGGGDRVKGATTSDLNIAYEFESGALEGKRIYLDVKNLFDQDPAYYNGNTSGIGVGAWGYNGFVSNPLGRIISVGFSARF